MHCNVTFFSPKNRSFLELVHLCVFRFQVNICRRSKKITWQKQRWGGKMHDNAFDVFTLVNSNMERFCVIHVEQKNGF